MKTVSIKQNTGLGARWRSLARRLCLSIRAGALARIVDGYLIRASVAGEPGKAVIADERMVELGWWGKTEWLEQHWALERLKADPRFQSAVRAHRAAR